MLVVLSAALGTLLTWLDVPAAMLLGPIVAGIAVTAAGGELQVSQRAFLVAQGLIGCLVANALPGRISGEFGRHWPFFAAGVLSVIAVSAFLGWLLTRMRILPGTTALWGLSPGAATVMTLMSESYGADMQLVAFMQYLRLIMVAAVASILARFWQGNTLHAVTTTDLFAEVAWMPLLKTLVLALSGPLLAWRLRIRAGAILIPLVGGVLFVHCGWMTIELPRWLLMMAYVIIGWQIGLRFTRPLLAHVIRTLPQVAGCTFALIAICMILAALLVVVGRVDPLTAYLAMSPGGADTVAIIAASSNVDLPFVMSMQMLRLVGVLTLGPVLAQFLARRVAASPESKNSESPASEVLR